jgi:hypothetical protein
MLAIKTNGGLSDLDFGSSPWMRGAPQRALLTDTSDEASGVGDRAGRPSCRYNFQYQNRRMPIQ